MFIVMILQCACLGRLQNCSLLVSLCSPLLFLFLFVSPVVLTCRKCDDVKHAFEMSSLCMQLK